MTITRAHIFVVRQKQRCNTPVNVKYHDTRDSEMRQL